MSKKILDDFKKKPKKIIAPKPMQQEEIVVVDTEVVYKTYPKSNRSNNLRTLVIILGVVSFIGILYGILNMFQVAHITITTKHQTLSLNNQQFTAVKDVGYVNANKNPITFELMIVSDEQNKNVVFSQSDNASSKAKGVVTFYNVYSKNRVELPMHTFIADTTGKAYQTDKAVSIPGYTKVANKVVPGKVTIGITAFLAGDSYNGSPSNFTVTAFKKTAKYNNIYGKIQTPLTGGALGQVYKIDPQTEADLNSIATSSFKDNLTKKLIAQIPAGYFLYPNATKFTYKVDDTVLSPTPDTNVKISGTLSAVLLKENDISKVLLNTLFPDTGADELKEIALKDISTLAFNFTDPNQLVDKSIQSVRFNLTGSITALWQPNVDTIKTNLTGVPKDTISTIFKQDPGIVSATVRLFPPWQSYIPSDISKIKISTQ